MIDYATFSRLRQLANEGHRASTIARILSLNRRTVHRWLDEHGYRRSAASGSHRASKLDPFKPDVIRMLETHAYTAAQILQRLRPLGYPGGYTIVKEFIAKVRPARSPAYQTLQFAPGDYAQVDWGNAGFVKVGDTTRRLSFFIMVLCHSRMMFVRFTLSQTMEQFLDCMQKAFGFFGGVCAHVMVDNCKVAVLEHKPGCTPIFNPHFVDFANHFGFQIVACGVRRPTTKGRVESGVGYVKGNFLNGLEFDQFSMVNPAVELWLRDVANVRNHAETHRRPCDMFSEDTAALLPLPANPYDVSITKQCRASCRCRISVDGNRYSIPAACACKPLTVRIHPDRICVYDASELIALHPRSYEHHKDIVNPDHVASIHNQESRKARHALLRFLAICPRAQEFFEHLQQRNVNPMRHVRGILALSASWGMHEIKVAIDAALAYQVFSVEYIHHFLQCSKTIRQPVGSIHLTENQDALDLNVPEPDMNAYQPTTEEVMP